MNKDSHIQQDSSSPQGARPYLKFVGGKSQLLDRILPLVPKTFNVYYEPFVGGGAVFFGLQGRSDVEFPAMLSDSNVELMNAYIQIRDYVEELIEHLKNFMFTETMYYRVRGMNPAKLTRLEAAARFIYLNKTCFNGLYRVNQSGQFNVPMGRYKNPTICDSSNLRACARALKGIELRVADFAEAITEAKVDDFLYVDPPYEPASKTSNFASYTKSGFAWDQQQRLHKALTEASGRGAKILLSQADGPKIRELYDDWVITDVTAKRSVNSKAGSRGAVGELLIRNFVFLT